MKREMIINSLEEMCDLMCGGIEEDYDEVDETLRCEEKGNDNEQQTK